MDNSFIITPDRFLSLAHNYMSRYGTRLELTPQNNIFFLHSDNIEAFQTTVLSKINYRFILITHDADAPVNEKWMSILNNPNLVKWFGMNCHILHEKLHPVPIGMANEVWPHGNKDIMTKVIQENNSKKNLVYCNFDPNTNFVARSQAISVLQNYDFIDFEPKKLDYETYLRKLSTYKYVISPPGNSVDCHRIWEAMYLRVIPIVLKSIPMVCFKDAPILFINDWTDITENLLSSKYDATLCKPTFKSDFNHYKELILTLAKSIL